MRCAVTGAPIPLEELKYWSVDLQEAYVSPEVGAAAASSPTAAKRLDGSIGRAPRAIRVPQQRRETPAVILE